MAILDSLGNPIDASTKRNPDFRRALRQNFHRNLQAKYDAAQTTRENEKHWAQADGLSAAAAGNAAVRKRLRERARYEVANDSYAAGMVQAKTVDVIGSVPRLSVTLEDPGVSSEIATKFSAWAAAINLGAKLRVLYRTYLVDGEGFMLRVMRPRPVSPLDEEAAVMPQLDYVLYEADQVASPNLAEDTVEYRDGVHLDQFGYPIAYDVLRVHPGDSATIEEGAERFEARSRMLHLYRIERPGQVRGIPHLTPALSLFAKRRRFALATITAAETAANLAAVLYTDHAALTDDDIAALDEDSFFDLPRGSLPVMPMGYKLSQLRSEHPNDTYQQFTTEILQEIARCFGMPLIVAAANAGSHNYASGRLDHQMYHRLIDVDRHWIATNILDLILQHWLEEALLLPGYLPPAAFSDLPHRWYYDPKPHVDPAKEATGFTTLWDRGLALDEDFFLQVLGRDPLDAYASMARQLEARKASGLPLPAASAVSTPQEVDDGE